MKKIFGIDLGTTNSLIAFNQDGETEIIQDRQGHRLIPSIISFMDNQTHVVGHRARELMNSNPSKTVYSAKRYMGVAANEFHESPGSVYKANQSGNYIEAQIGDRSYSIPEISSYVLAELKKNAERFFNESVEDVVITVPAYFNDHQRQETRKAGQLAGLNVLKIINEPTAAALAYGIDKDNCKIAVYDFGGGTFDISILHIRNGAFEVLSTNGNTQLGGDDIDRAIVDYIIEKNKWNDLSSDEKEELRLLAVEAKHRLSETYEIELSGRIGSKQLQIAISIDDFKKISSAVIDKTKRYVRSALKDAELDFDDIDEIVMVGGSTRIPFVQESVESWFNKKPHTDLDPDEVVAIGAAIQGSILAGTITETVLLDITPLSLGMETMGGVVEKFVMRNSKIPCSVTETFTTAVDNQNSVSIHIVQGEREFAKDNTSLGRFVLSGIAPKPAGHARIDVRFQLDQNGVLQVNAKDQSSQNEQQIVVQSSQGLTDEKVEELLRDSIAHAKEDVEQRLLVEACTEANAIIQSCENALQKHSELISPEEIKSIRESMKSLQSAVDDHIDRKLITDLIDQLDEKSQEFAEIIMNSSIKSALENKRLNEIK